MAIEEKYQEILRQCENRLSELSDWERGFVMGEEGNPKKPPLSSRNVLSLKQKEILDRIVCERFEGKKWDNKKLRVEYGIINAGKTESGWKVSIADYPVGFGVTRKEIVVITAWLDSALSAILSIPSEELTDYLDGQAAEIPEPGEEEDPIPFGEPDEENADDEPF